jgi:thymidylate synthase ThyX
MEVLQQHVKLINGLRPLELVEFGARICYASTDKIKPGSAKTFVGNLVSRGHYTPLEHAYLRIYLDRIEDQAVKSYVTAMHHAASPSDYPFANRSLTRGGFYRGKDDTGDYVCGNLRDVFMYMSAHDPSLDFYASDAVQLDPDYMVFELLTDRGIATEFFRHRTMSYDDSGYEKGCVSYSVEYVPEMSLNQQSTRYVNFSRHEGALILPEPFKFAYDPTSAEYQTWYNTCAAAFESYKLLTEHKVPPEAARDVLPLSTATTVVMSGSLLNWLYVINLRIPQVHIQGQECWQPPYGIPSSSGILMCCRGTVRMADSIRRILLLISTSAPSRSSILSNVTKEIDYANGRQLRFQPRNSRIYGLPQEPGRTPR